MLDESSIQDRTEITGRAGGIAGQLGCTLIFLAAMILLGLLIYFFGK